MDLLTSYLIWIAATATTMALTAGIYVQLKRREAKLRARKITRALSKTHALLTAIEHIPDPMINRDLRRGLVLLMSHHIDVLHQTNPEHPHLRALRNKVAQINRLPSGLKSAKLRSKVERRHASSALEELAKLLKDATAQGELNQREGSLAQASAKFTGQQIAVEIARQSAKDAENIRAYPQALHFAKQARQLCRDLPPMVGSKLMAAVAADIERLESRLDRSARI
ncbi:MAG: hypothetical protein ACFHXK_08035 [bacterium]